MLNITTVKRLEELRIVFKDKILRFKINNDALILMTEMYGDICELIKKEKEKPYDFVSKLLYCGVKINHSDFKYETSQQIVVSGGILIISEILDHFTKNFIPHDTLVLSAEGDVKNIQKAIIDWDFLYYIYCIEMKQTEESFREGSLAKILTLIDIHSQFKSGKITRQISKKKITTRQILGL